MWFWPPGNQNRIQTNQNQIHQGEANQIEAKQNQSKINPTANQNQRAGMESKSKQAKLVN